MYGNREWSLETVLIGFSKVKLFKDKIPLEFHAVSLKKNCLTHGRIKTKNQSK